MISKGFRDSAQHQRDLVIGDVALDDLPIELVPIRDLLPADSPRAGGEDADHVRALAETEAPLVPIIVHRDTMRVIDGMHRMRAAELRGATAIRVRFVDTTEEDAFVVAVMMNVGHGLPLTTAERKAAAARVLVSHPHWSDRIIAAKTGLAARTVSQVRSSVATGSGRHQPEVRVGRDGRRRPLSCADGRRIAADFLIANPGASLREVARVAGISPGTVRDVRNRLRDNVDPVTTAPRTGRGPAEPELGSRRARRTAPEAPRPVGEQASDVREVLRGLRTDPTLRFSDSGRLLLRLLEANCLPHADQQHLVHNAPEHCAERVLDVARACAGTWAEIVRQMERRVELVNRGKPDDRASA